MIIVSSSVTPPPPPPVSNKKALAMALVGVDGSTWDLVNGPVRVGSGVAGLSGPDPEHFWRDAPGLDGSFHAGYRTPRGQVTLPVRVTGSTSVEWRTNDRAFMRAIDPSGECTLMVTPPDGGVTRSLQMRLISGMSPAFNIDPSLLGHSARTLDFATPYPFWNEGLTSILYAPAGHGPGVETDTVTNPGDVPVWPRWVITGPYDKAIIGIGEAKFSLETPIADVARRAVDTDPHSPDIAVTNGGGVDKWSEMVLRRFAPIPPGNSQVTIDIVNETTSSSVRLEFTPAYRNPW